MFCENRQKINIFVITMKKLLLCFALLPICILLNAQEEKRDSTGVEDAVLDAVALLESGGIHEAEAALDSLAAVYPGNDAIRYYQGLCRYTAGDFKAAAERFGEAVKLDSTNYWYKETLANLYLNSGEVKAAEKLLRELQTVKPGKFPELYVSSMLAASYRIKRDYPSYFATLQSLVKDRNSDDESKYEALMSVLGNFDTRTYNALLPDIDTLVRAYADAEPRSLHAHSLCMQIAASRENYPRVIEECETLISLSPDDTAHVVNCLSIIGDSWYATGQTRKAYKTYDQALRLDPGYCPVLNNYAWYLCTEKKKLAKAERMSLITVTREPDNPTYLDTYGWILYLRGKAGEAKPYFKHAMLYGGKDSAVILMHFSKVLEKLGEKDLASYYRNLAEAKNK